MQTNVQIDSKNIRNSEQGKHGSYASGGRDIKVGTVKFLIMIWSKYIKKMNKF